MRRLFALWLVGLSVPAFSQEAAPTKEGAAAREERRLGRVAAQYEEETRAAHEPPKDDEEMLAGRFGHYLSVVGAEGFVGRSLTGSTLSRKGGSVVLLFGSDGLVGSYGTRIGVEIDLGLGLGTLFLAPGQKTFDPETGEETTELAWHLRFSGRTKIIPLHFVSGEDSLELGVLGGFRLGSDLSQGDPFGAWVLGPTFSVASGELSANLSYLWQPRQGEDLVLGHTFSAYLGLGPFFLGGRLSRYFVPGGQVDTATALLGLSFEFD